MNKTTPSGGASSSLWTSNQQSEISQKLANFIVDQHSKSSDPEIINSLYYLGRALYRYSLLQKQRGEYE